jgi:hypothetical protein
MNGEKSKKERNRPIARYFNLIAERNFKRKMKTAGTKKRVIA